MPFAILGLLPAVHHQADLFVAPNERRQPGDGRRLEATFRCAFPTHGVDAHRLGNASQRLHAEVFEVERAAHQPLGAGANHQLIGNGHAFKPGGNIRGLTQGQALMTPASPHLAHHDWPGVDPEAHGDARHSCAEAGC